MESNFQKWFEKKGSLCKKLDLENKILYHHAMKLLWEEEINEIILNKIKQFEKENKTKVSIENVFSYTEDVKNYKVFLQIEINTFLVRYYITTCFDERDIIITVGSNGGLLIKEKEISLIKYLLSDIENILKKHKKTRLKYRLIKYNLNIKNLLESS